MLHTLSHSPAQVDLPALCRLLAPGDDVLLLQDGVLAAVGGAPEIACLLNASISLYALRADVEARGLSAHILHSVTVIDYTDFVALTVKHRQQVAW